MMPVIHPLAIAMTPPGHWHFTKAKRLAFAVTDGVGVPVPGLEPHVTVRTMSGRLDELVVVDEGSGSYGADYFAPEIGADAATAYAVACTVSYDDHQYTGAWPVEVVRDGLEGIFTPDGRYLYQVRYGWNPGEAVAGVAIDLRFEPRRALPEGEALERRQPYRNLTDYLPGLEATIAIRTESGELMHELTAVYAGTGIYHAVHTFTPEEVATGRTALVSLQFTDTATGVAIGAAENSFALRLRPAAGD